MKGVLVLLDGLGDLPCKQLDDKTPLEAAEMPNINFLATRSETGIMNPVKPGFVPQSDEAIVSIFGNDITESSRGQLEARGTDLKLVRGDLAMRVNFATIDSLKGGNVIDRRAGRTLTTEEAEILSKAINKIKLPCEFTFKSTIQHRGVIVFRGGFSDNITGNDLEYTGLSTKRLGNFKALDDEDNTQYTVNILKEFSEKVFEVLNSHPVNNERKRKGLLPANYLLLRGPGIEPPKLRFYRKWGAIVYMPLEIGFAKTSGMKVFSFEYPKLKSLDSYENLREGLAKACDFSVSTLKKNYKDFDYFYIHIKETDLPGHDNKPLEKKSMLEHIDRTLFKFLREFAPPNRIKVVVTGDHSTPCRLKTHSADPVPVLFYNFLPPKKKTFRVASLFAKMGDLSEEKVVLKEESTEKPTLTGFKKTDAFCERTSRRGALGEIQGNQLLDKVEFFE